MRVSLRAHQEPESLTTGVPGERQGRVGESEGRWGECEGRLGEREGLFGERGIGAQRGCSALVGEATRVTQARKGPGHHTRCEFVVAGALLGAAQCASACGVKRL